MCPTRQPVLGRLRPVLALSFAAGLALAGCGTTSSVDAATQSPAATGSVHAPAWDTLPAAPLPRLRDVTGAWTGKELLVVGTEDLVGTDDKGAGHAAAYDPATRRWRVLAGPPKRGVTQAGPRSVWTGTELVVWGGSHREIFNLATNRWREIPEERVNAPANSQLVWTGSRVIGFGGGCCGGAESTAGMLDPATGTWEPLPKGPLTARWTSAVWTGTEVVFAGGYGYATASQSGDLTGLRDGAAYNPVTRTWRALPPLPIDGASALFWDGKRVVATTDSGAATWSPGAGAWTALPRPKLAREAGAAVLAGDHLLVIGGSVPGTYPDAAPPVDGEVIQIPGGTSWTPLPKATGLRVDPVIAWTGSQVLLYANGDTSKALALTL